MTMIERASITAVFAGLVFVVAQAASAQESVPSPDPDGATVVDPPPDRDDLVETVPETDPIDSVERTGALDSDGFGPGYGAPPPAVAEESYAEALYAQDVLKVATSVGLAATGVLGLISAINQPTAFGDGRCSDDGVPPDQGRGVGGKWGCDGMNIVHGALGVGTTLLYTSEQVTGLAIPGDEPDHGGFHQALTYVHVGGMVLTPALGLLSANPRVFGIDDSADSDWPRVGRTIHMGVALLTAGAYWTTTLIELTADTPHDRELSKGWAPSGSSDPWGAF